MSTSLRLAKRQQHVCLSGCFLPGPPGRSRGLPAGRSPAKLTPVLPIPRRSRANLPPQLPCPATPPHTLPDAGQRSSAPRRPPASPASQCVGTHSLADQAAPIAATALPLRLGLTRTVLRYAGTFRASPCAASAHRRTTAILLAISSTGAACKSATRFESGLRYQ